MKNLATRNLVNPKLVLEADKGATQGDCFRDAIELAAHYRMNVEFVHNDRRYTVDYVDLFGQVKEVAALAASL